MPEARSRAWLPDPAAMTAKLRTVGSTTNRRTGPAGRVVARVRRPLDRRFLTSASRLDDFRVLGEATAASAAPHPDSPRVLVVSLRAWVVHSGFEAIFAHALRLRGARTALLTCGGGLPICEVGWGRRIAPRACDRCGWFTDQFAAAAQIEHFRLADELAWTANPASAPAATPPTDVSLDALGLIDHSVAWFARSADPTADPDSAEIVADFRVTEAAVERAAHRILGRFQPDVVLAVNGLFAQDRIIGEVSRRRGIRVCSYEFAPRRGTLRYDQNGPAAFFDGDELWHQTHDRAITPDQDAILQRLLDERAAGVGAHETYFNSVEQSEDLRARLGIAAGQRVIALFTNVTWDSACLRRHVSYPSMLAWVVSAARIARDLPDVTLVIRIHPAATKWGTRDDPQDALVRSLGALPRNVRVVASTMAIDSYAIVAIADTVLAYSTTMGLEAAVRGRPVVVAGAVHYRGRGFTWDIEGDEALRAVMANPALAMTDEQVELARRYAFGFFFRCMIPFRPMEGRNGRVGAVTTDPGQLEPGRDPYLDFACDRILDGGPFILPDELAIAEPTAQSVTSAAAHRAT